MSPFVSVWGLGKNQYLQEERRWGEEREEETEVVPYYTSEVLLFPTDSIEDEFELSTVCHRPEGLEQLQEQTKFSRKELQVLYRGFKNVSWKDSLPFLSGVSFFPSLHSLWVASLLNEPP